MQFEKDSRNSIADRASPYGLRSGCLRQAAPVRQSEPLDQARPDRSPTPPCCNLQSEPTERGGIVKPLVVFEEQTTPCTDFQEYPDAHSCRL